MCEKFFEKYNVAPTLDFETESSFNFPIEQGKT